MERKNKFTSFLPEGKPSLRAGSVFTLKVKTASEREALRKRNRKLSASDASDASDERNVT